MANPDELVKKHMQEINDALKQGNMEKVRRHYTAILEIYGYYDED